MNFVRFHVVNFTSNNFFVIFLFSEKDEESRTPAPECGSDQSHTNKNRPVEWNWFAVLFSKFFPCFKYATGDVSVYSCKIINYVAISIITCSIFNPIDDFISNGRLLVIGVTLLIFSHCLFRNAGIIFSALLSLEIYAFIDEYYFRHVNTYLQDKSWFSHKPHLELSVLNQLWRLDVEMWYVLIVIICQYFIFTAKVVLIFENSTSRRLTIPLLFFGGFVYFLWKMVNQYIHFGAVDIKHLIIFVMLMWAGLKLIFV